MTQKSGRYFVLEPSDVKATSLMKRADSWSNSVISTSYLEKCRNSWLAYYGAHNAIDGNSHQITFGGEQGELVKIAINHYHNIATHLINMTTANRPALEAMSINTDYKSQSQTILANGLLDYYMYQKRLEDFLAQAVESAVVLAEGYVRIAWNTQGGDPAMVDDLGNTHYTGDIEFSNILPWDVIRDTSKEDTNFDWILIRTYKNRYDLSAKYPDLEDEIMAVDTKDKGKLRMITFEDETDQIPVYEFYHRKSEAVPNGNYMSFVSPEAVLYDGPLPYRGIPVYRISPGDIMGTPMGYTQMWDILPIQDAVNTLYSTVLTNQTAFGVQNIAAPKGSDINVHVLEGGMNLVEYDGEMQPPSPLNLTQTPKEVFDFTQMLEKAMETISAVNSVVRGDPQSSLRSAEAIAIVQAQALQYANKLQQSYIKLVESVGTGLIQMLQDYASEPRIAVITGKSQRTYLKEFKGSDLNNVNRVTVRMSNPLSKSTGGKLEIAKSLQQMGFIKTPEQYFQVLSTGRLDSMYEGDIHQLMLIKLENEQMLDGEQPSIVETDQHMLHITEHQALLCDPDIRKDEKLRTTVLDHMKGHVDMLRTADPDFLQLLHQQPLPPSQPPQDPNAHQGPPGAPPSGPGPMTQDQAQASQTASNVNAQPMSPPAQVSVHVHAPEAPQLPNGIMPPAQQNTEQQGMVPPGGLVPQK